MVPPSIAWPASAPCAAELPPIAFEEKKTTTLGGSAMQWPSAAFMQPPSGPSASERVEGSHARGDRCLLPRPGKEQKGEAVEESEESDR